MQHQNDQHLFAVTFSSLLHLKEIKPWAATQFFSSILPNWSPNQQCVRWKWGLCLFQNTINYHGVCVIMPQEAGIIFGQPSVTLSCKIKVACFEGRTSSNLVFLSTSIYILASVCTMIFLLLILFYHLHTGPWLVRNQFSLLLWDILIG